MVERIDMKKYLILLIVVFIVGCGPSQKESSEGFRLSNQKDIDYIIKKSIKYGGIKGKAFGMKLKDVTYGLSKKEIDTIFSDFLYYDESLYGVYHFENKIGKTRYYFFIEFIYSESKLNYIHTYYDSFKDTGPFFVYYNAEEIKPFIKWAVVKKDKNSKIIKYPIKTIAKKKDYEIGIKICNHRKGISEYTFYDEYYQDKFYISIAAYPKGSHSSFPRFIIFENIEIDNLHKLITEVHKHNSEARYMVDYYKNTSKENYDKIYKALNSSGILISVPNLHGITEK